MKKLLVVIITVAFALFEAYQQGQGEATADGVVQTLSSSNNPEKQHTILQRAYNNQQSDLQVQGEGIVTKVLRDDLKGSRHQKFILKVAADHTVLVAHNIDLAPRIDDLKKGDRVAFYGEYEWNSRGGVIHWTHKDPKRYHTSGWLKHKGRTYQ